jgi:hypothetical protein
VILEKHPHYLSSFGTILTEHPLADTDDITDAVLWLAGDGSRRVTGSQVAVDMGNTKV